MYKVLLCPDFRISNKKSQQYLVSSSSVYIIWLFIYPFLQCSLSYISLGYLYSYIFLLS